MVRARCNAAVKGNMIAMMLDDLLVLTSEIDCLVDVFKAMKRGQKIPAYVVEHMVDSASDVSEEIFDRWERLELDAVI